MVSLSVHLKLLSKKFYFFSSSIRMSRKSVNFENKKIKKSDFSKNKKVNQIDDINDIYGIQ